MKRKVLLALILGFLISGCASSIGVTYYSFPAGGTLFEGEGQRNLGTLPRTYQYAVSKSNKMLGYITVLPMTAMWPSGASSSVSGLRLYLDKGRNQQFTFFRPKDVSGNELDVQNAIEQKRNRLRAQEARRKAQQEILERQRKQTSDALQKQVDILQNIKLQSPQRLRTNCTSTRVGSTVYTDCW